MSLDITLPHDRILLLDGAMGTEIMRRNLTEADFRGERFADHPVALKGDNDVLCITRPDVIAEIHDSYLQAGADIIETCTFNAQSISQQEYSLSADDIDEINRSGARIARKCVDRAMAADASRRRYVAGSVGPTSKMATMGAISYDELYDAYLRQMTVLIAEGVDMLLIETCLDTLNAKCALDAAHAAMKRVGREVGLMVSLTVADKGGHVLSGSSIEAFVASVSHASLLSIGINCSAGASTLMPHLRTLAACCPVAVSVHPNAGLPDALGRYMDTPEIMAAQVAAYLDNNLVDIIGGCCGTTPAHIAAMRRLIDTSGRIPRSASRHTDAQPASVSLQLAGTECMPRGTFVNVGERCNVAGSRKFLRLISSGEFEEAVDIARKQVEDGAMVIDVNMDDAMLDTPECMERFLTMAATDPDVARVPVMIDSSRWEVIERALKCVQGRAIVNSLSLKEGEDVFIERASRVKALGAALVVMAFDEQGQATTYERRIEVCERAYRLLVDKVGFAPQDIIFDPNVLTVATGIAEHADYALDFVRASRWIRDNLPGAGVSGGVSNLSFAFRGNNPVREAMHAVFLYHAIHRGGLTMAIMNPSTSVTYESITTDLRHAIEDVLFDERTPESVERLLAIASSMANEATSASSQGDEKVSVQTEMTIDQRLTDAIVHGQSSSIGQPLLEAIERGSTPLEIISGPLMEGMDRVGTLFGQGKMFLPQVVKTARTMRVAVDILAPYMHSKTDASSASRGRILMATVKGDVHDIGKNIVGIILECNGYEIVDLGVMVPAETIVEQAKAVGADIVCLSGLITPSLDEMCTVAAAMQQAGMTVPLMIGGATTSALHTAVRIAPLYPSGVVLHMADAAQNPIAAAKLLGDNAVRDAYIEEIRSAQHALHQPDTSRNFATPASAHSCPCCGHAGSAHATPDPVAAERGAVDVATLRPLISWTYFYHAWKVKADTPEAAELRQHAEQLLDTLEVAPEKYHVSYSRAFYRASSTDDGIELGGLFIPTPRQAPAPGRDKLLSLSDFVSPDGDDTVGIFATAVSRGFTDEIARLKSDALMQYEMLLWQTVADRLAEAAAEYCHRQTGWGGIRPAVGYPSLPDQRVIFTLDRLMPLKDIGISLTENGAMFPPSSTAGIYIANPDARYFNL